MNGELKGSAVELGERVGRVERVQSILSWLDTSGMARGGSGEKDGLKGREGGCFKEAAEHLRLP